MSSRRTLILIAAIVVGGLAAFLTLRYVSGVENETAAKNQLVDVLVATGPIPKGSSSDAALAAGQISVDKRRRADLPAAATRRPADIQGQTAAVDLSGGEIITSTMFGAEADLSGSKAVALEKGNVALTISVGGAAGVAGLVQPGDLINIMADVKEETPAGDEAAAGGDGLVVTGTAIKPSKSSIYAFQGVKVLAVGTQMNIPQPQAQNAAADAEGEAAPAQDTGDRSLITVQLPPDQALKLASMRDSGLYLTLNRPDYEGVPSPYNPLIVDLPGLLGASPYLATPAAESGQ